MGGALTGNCRDGSSAAFNNRRPPRARRAGWTPMAGPARRRQLISFRLDRDEFRSGETQELCLMRVTGKPPRHAHAWAKKNPLAPTPFTKRRLTGTTLFAVRAKKG